MLFYCAVKKTNVGCLRNLDKTRGLLTNHVTHFLTLKDKNKAQPGCGPMCFTLFPVTDIELAVICPAKTVKTVEILNVQQFPLFYLK